jgi:hypothetical protein
MTAAGRPRRSRRGYPDAVGVERMGLIDRLEMRQAAAKGEKPNAS